MITATPQEVIDEARSILKKSFPKCAGAINITDDFFAEGEWLHLIVAPTGEGVSALDFVDTVEAVEVELRKKFGNEVLIVPARP